jgi:hypothetical protein
MLSFDEALQTVLAATNPVAAERVSVFEAAGRILREDIHARAPLPGFDYSAMDGYAFRHADLGPAPHQLALDGTSSAGEPLSELAPKSACRIYTGAVIPHGADTVVMQEEVRATPASIEFDVAPSVGANIRKTGEDMAAGALALRAGEELHPGRVALAACLDRATLVVARRPLVSVLGTGDELRSPGEPGALGSVVESNGFFVKAAAERAGASARLHRFVRPRRHRPARDHWGRQRGRSRSRAACAGAGRRRHQLLQSGDETRQADHLWSARKNTRAWPTRKPSEFESDVPSLWAAADPHNVGGRQQHAELREDPGERERRLIASEAR